MRQCDDFIEMQNKRYQARRDVVCDGLRRIGWEVEKPRASMFVLGEGSQGHLKGKGSLEYALDLWNMLML